MARGRQLDDARRVRARHEPQAARHRPRRGRGQVPAVQLPRVHHDRRVRGVQLAAHPRAGPEALPRVQHPDGAPPRDDLEQRADDGVQPRERHEPERARGRVRRDQAERVGEPEQGVRGRDAGREVRVHRDDGCPCCECIRQSCRERARSDLFNARQVGACLVYTPERGIDLDMLRNDVKFLKRRYGLDAKGKAEGRLVLRRVHFFLPAFVNLRVLTDVQERDII